MFVVTTDASIARTASIRPVVAVIAVVVMDGRVLLVRRANPPDAGRWGFPGGKIEFGETINQAAIRELAEETAITAEAMCIVTSVDAFGFDERGVVTSHFVLIAVLCRWLSGSLLAGDDALEARWYGLDEVDETQLDLSKDVAEVAELAARIYGNESGT